MLNRLRPLFPYLKKYRRGYFFGTLSVLLDNGTWILFPLFIGRAFDDLRAGITQQKLVYWALILIAITLVKGVFRFLTRWIVIGISRDIEFDLRNDLFRHLEELPSSYYART